MSHGAVVNIMQNLWDSEHVERGYTIVRGKRRRSIETTITSSPDGLDMRGVCFRILRNVLRRFRNECSVVVDEV
jgi:hypothetical protein